MQTGLDVIDGIQRKDEDYLDITPRARRPAAVKAIV
jgi:hypothetical protein